MVAQAKQPADILPSYIEKLVNLLDSLSDEALATVLIGLGFTSKDLEPGGRLNAD